MLLKPVTRGKSNSNSANQIWTCI